MPKFRSKDGSKIGSIGWGGQEYFPDAQNEVTVPTAAVADLKHHDNLVFVEGSEMAVPMPAEAEDAYLAALGKLEQAKVRIKALEEENDALAREKRMLLARVKELETLSGSEIDEEANVDKDNPRFGAMTVDQMKSFSEEHRLDVDLAKGSIAVKRSALKDAWEAAKKKLSGE